MSGARCQGDANHVVEESPEEILPDEAHRLLAQRQRLGESSQVIAHECHLCHVDGHVGAAAHGDAHVGLRQRL